MAIVDPKDSVFANAADAVSDFETIFDEEDSIIEMVEGFGENGESLIGRDPEEDYTTDNDDGKVDMEDSSPSTAQTLEPDAETGKGVIESMDLDDLFGIGESDDGSAEKIDADAEDGKEVNKALDAGQADNQTDETDKKDILEEPVETDEKDFHNEAVDLDELFESLIDESDEQTDETNKSDILEEPVETDEKDFHNESAELDELFESLIDESDEQTDETNKKDILEEPVETDNKDFHDGEVNVDNVKECGPDPITAASLVGYCGVCGSSPCKCKGTDNKSKAEEQTDDTNKSDILEEPVETDEKDFHNEGAELDRLFESLGLTESEDEQTDETDKKDILEEPVETDVKDFHNEGAELDKLFESLDLEGEDDHDEFDDSFEGMDSLKVENEAAEDDIDYAEDELIDVADKDEKVADMKLDYKPGEDDVIIDDVISGKE